MEFNKGYQEINEKIDYILSLPQNVIEPEKQVEFRKLQQAIRQDVFSIVVLGEFSRGKSTFINALIGEPLLPMDVLPETAAIQVLQYSEKPEVEIIYHNGMVKQGEASFEYLKQFSAQAKKNVTDGVKYLRVGYPSSLLKKQVVVVDTPGVSDMDEQRVEVTYGFLPRADMVLFLLDASSPLKKTEKEFLEKRVLPQGIKDIVFVVNKFDNLDEEEIDEKEFLDKLRARLEKAFRGDGECPGLEKIELFPLSAKRALKNKGVSRDDSWMAPLYTRLKQAAEEQRTTIKLARFKWQYRRLIQSIYNQVLSKKLLHEANIQQLEKAKQCIEVLLIERKHGQKLVSDYMEKEQQVILNMTDKSLKHFYQRLEEDVMDMVENYCGEDFKDFIEVRVIKRIQREIDNWIGMYGPRILQLIRKIELQISQGLSQKFEQQVMIESRQKPVISGNEFFMDITARDVSNTKHQVETIGAIVGGGLILASGTFLMPAISMAVLPKLKEVWFKKNLMAAKEEVKEKLSEQLVQCMYNLQQNMYDEIRNKCTISVKNLSSAYELLLSEYRDKIDSEINEKNIMQHQISSYLEEDKKMLDMIKKLQIQ